MGTDETCALIETRILSPEYKTYIKTGWLHTDLLAARGNPAVVAMYKRLLASNVKEDRVREALVQTLFCYRPSEWYGSEYHGQYAPPKWKTYSTVALEELLTIADAAEKLDVSDEAKAGVAKARNEIQTVLEARKSEK